MGCPPRLGAAAGAPELKPLAEILAGPVLPAARRLLGCTLILDGVTVRVTEVEAYAGARDPGSHAFRGRTARTDVMFGPSGHAYVYFTYGMHWCLNVVCGSAGEAAAVLLRAGEVVGGADLAHARRPGAPPRDLARGPARLTKALGIGREHNCAYLLGDGSAAVDRASGSWADRVDSSPGYPADRSPADPVGLHLAAGRPVPSRLVDQGPRVGVAGAGAARPWRFWIAGDPTVSAYRPAAPRPPRRPS